MNYSYIILILALLLSPPAAAQTAIALIARGNNQEALAQIDRNEESLRPADQNLLRAYASLNMGRLSDADIYTSLAADSSDKFLYFSLLARLASQRHQFNKAAWYYRRASDYAKSEMDERVVARQINIAQAKRKWDWDGYFNVQRSDNLNFVTTSEYTTIGSLKFKLDENSRAKKGWKILAGFGGKFRLANTPKRLVTLGAQIGQTRDSANKRNEHSQSFNFNWQEHFGRTNMNFSARTTTTKAAQTTRAKSLNFTIGRQVSPDLHLGFTLGKAINDTPDYTQVDIDKSLFASLTVDPTVNISANFTITNRPHAAANIDSFGKKARINVTFHPTQIPLAFSFFAEKESRHFRQETPFYGGFRNDETNKLGATLTPTEISFAGFQPSLTLAKTIRKSNKDIYSASSKEVYFGLNSKF